MMTTLTRYMKKITAVAMATIAFSLPLASVASAHERHDNPPPPPRHEDRYDRHDRHHNNSHKDKHYKYDRKHKSCSYVSKSSSNKKAATSFLVGAAIGAIVAKNT